ncbi:unnamed protein product [Allacma fusca]|uniref:Uncharacterized protein n=1 Tax=Allacma fusca TaxID=39272 RepID=A0A8J2L0K7_9HEXA|nr:unnamed protein product [Allacma fusca]
MSRPSQFKAWDNKAGKGNKQIMEFEKVTTDNDPIMNFNNNCYQLPSLTGAVNLGAPSPTQWSRSWSNKVPEEEG